MKRHAQFITLLMGLTVCTLAGAAEKDLPMSVNTNTSGDTISSVPAAGMVSRSGKDSVNIKIINTCFGMNLRGVGNPLSPNAIITADLDLMIGGTEHKLTVKYPSQLVTVAGMKESEVRPMLPETYSIPGGGAAGIYGNTVLLKTSIPSGVSVDASGNITVANKGDVYLKSYRFTQEVDCSDRSAIYGSYGYSASRPTYSCGDFMGKNGDVSASFGGLAVSSDRSNVELNISFPGQTGFCGSYWSPLMVFFDDARPKFTNTSDFPLNPMGKTMWPEANAPGWFLAIDRNNNGVIDAKNELFGDNASVENGFEVLKQFDTNKDGVIDKKDKDFDKLVLWRDFNGDGISQKPEMVKLSKMKIIKISLDYKKGIVEPIGRYAEARERAKFWYKENGKIKTGEIIDIWLAPAETRLSQK